MANKIISKAFMFLMSFLLSLSIVGCADFFKGTTRLLVGTYEVPTPYITPVAHGTPRFLVTPYPQGTPVFDPEICMTVAGSEYLFDAEILYYSFKGLRSEADEIAQEDLPPIIDEMREIHAEYRVLNPPLECEILVALDYAYEVEVDQTIRELVAFRNLESEEVWMEFLKEAVFYNERIQELLDRIY